MAKPQPPKTSVNIDDESWVRWFSEISTRSLYQLSFTQSLTIASVPANTTNEQILTVKGILADDVILSMKVDAPDAGIVIYNARVTAVDTIKLVFGNLTGGAIVPAAQIYTFYIIRP